MTDPTRRHFLQYTGAATGVAMLRAPALANEPGARTTAKVAPHKGTPTLFINGAPTPPLIYYFPVPVKEHIAGFYNSGVRIYSWGSSRVIGHCYDMGWVGPNRYDYSVFEEEMATILDVAPEAYLFPRLSVSAPPWWLDQNPGEEMILERDNNPKRRRTSMASKLWRREAGVALERFIHHVRKQPYANRIIGYQVVGGLNEWFYVGSGDRGFPDFSAPATSGFREWLKQRYKADLAHLQDAWKSSSVTFANAIVPSADQRMTPDVGLLRNPAASRQVSDFFEFLSDTNADALIEFCRIGKKASAGESIMGAFYGYLLNASGGASGGYAAQHWGHQALRKVLNAPEVDFLCAPYQYTYRGVGGAPTPQSFPESVKLAGKLWITECDNPSFVGRPGDWRMGAKEYTPTESFAVLKRDFSHNFIRRIGMWWMDLRRKGGWYDHPDIHKYLLRCRSLADNTLNSDIAYKGEVAVILDEESPYYVKPGLELLYPLVFLQDKLGLPRMGTPVDYYLHNDIARANMPDYKLYIFLNTIYMTEAERREITERLRKDNKVAVWMYAPGLLSESGMSADTMHDLTGIKLNYRAVSAVNHSMSSRLYLTDFTHPITKGLPDGLFFGSDSQISPVIFSEDPDATTLGRLLPSHGMPNGIGEFPGFVVKSGGDWTSVFIGAPNVPSAVLRNIARFAGCHIYNDQDALIEANSHFVSIHTASGGPKNIHLPRTTDVYDAFTEKLVARNTRKLTVDMPPYGTRLFYLGNVARIADAKTRFFL